MKHTDELECLFDGGHTWEPTSDWVLPTDPEGNPTHEGEYRTIACKDCPAVGTEGKAPTDEVRQQVQERQAAQALEEQASTAQQSEEGSSPSTAE